MEFTRRAWGVATVAGALALFAVLLERPLLLGGAAGVGGWLLARQWRFGREARTVHRGLSVRQSPARERVTAGESVAVTLAAAPSTPSPLRLRVEASPPVGTRAPDAGERTVTLAPGAERATASFPLTCPVAGRHAFGPATVTLADPAGLFESRVHVDADAAVTAAARAPRRVHVGEGGDRVAAFGQHRTGESGPGVEAAELREYVPGDPADDIDWKATARLGESYVREHEVETDRRVVLVVDHRASMAAGPPGERKLDYARQVALAYLDAARRNDEPVGLLAVGDGGVTERVAPDAGAGHVRRLADLLRDLEPTEDDGEGNGSGGVEPRAPAAARRAAAALADEDSAFARSLAPFYGVSTTYVERVTADPLYAAARSVVRERRSGVVTLVLTDDERRAELREALDAAAGGEGGAVAFLTPSALFAGEDVADLDRAYGRYVDFEEFRRGLAGRPRVDAYEVAPEDRIEAVLAAGRARR